MTKKNIPETMGSGVGEEDEGWRSSWAQNNLSYRALFFSYMISIRLWTDLPIR